MQGSVLFSWRTLFRWCPSLIPWSPVVHGVFLKDLVSQLLSMLREQQVMLTVPLVTCMRAFQWTALASVVVILRTPTLALLALVAWSHLWPRTMCPSSVLLVRGSCNCASLKALCCAMSLLRWLVCNSQACPMELDTACLVSMLSVVVFCVSSQGTLGRCKPNINVVCGPLCSREIKAIFLVLFLWWQILNWLASLDIERIGRATSQTYNRMASLMLVVGHVDPFVAIDSCCSWVWSFVLSKSLQCYAWGKPRGEYMRWRSIVRHLVIRPAVHLLHYWRLQPYLLQCELMAPYIVMMMALVLPAPAADLIAIDHHPTSDYRSFEFARTTVVLHLLDHLLVVPHWCCTVSFCNPSPCVLLGHTCNRSVAPFFACTDVVVWNAVLVQLLVCLCPFLVAVADEIVTVVVARSCGLCIWLSFPFPCLGILSVGLPSLIVPMSIGPVLPCQLVQAAWCKAAPLTSKVCGGKPFSYKVVQDFGHQQYALRPSTASQPLRFSGKQQVQNCMKVAFRKYVTHGVPLLEFYCVSPVSNSPVQCPAVTHREKHSQAGQSLEI